ncbi:FecR family protein [Paraburkholderia fungorum]|uniref:FecR family protein n=1 Tax=Paraburkholderia fungorum TaxID=134537 RepID=A0A1H1DEA0_9BURK|nr:DUF6600 domain-containing protein [Paraburkholderia fungorum]SDQ74730.1 FecR family protein [Paraburkholderia fungorum]
MRTVTHHRHSNRRSQGLTRYTLIATAAFLLAAQAGFAQELPTQPSPQEFAASNPNADPPGRVARLNYTAGAVTTEPAGATDWSYAQINRPLTTGDQLWNDQNARSELHIGSTAVRLGPSTSLDVLNLDDNAAQLKVAQGTLSTRVRELAPGSSYEIDTPNLALGLNGPGDYRVDVAPDGSSTTVTVRSGSATVYGDAGQVPVAAGQQVRFGGTGLQQLADNGVPGLDSLDQWAATRDAAEDRSVSAQYVSRDIPGYQDLDANGTWRNSPQYGEVWVPRATPAGWAPYHDGHWVWQAPWGWTWVDDEPWGFAPYHYGRWAQVDDTWAWVPGPVEADVQPVYAPALVAFVGDDEGGSGAVDWGVSLAVGGALAAGVAWFPLGPGEPWHPHWGGHDHWSPGYYNRVNRTTIVNNYNRNVDIHNTYINYHARGGLTAVPATAFVHGQPVGRFAQKVDPQQWRNARINPGGPGIAPVRESFGPGLRNANYRPPAAVMARPVVATRNPAMPAAYHDSLAQRFAQSGGRVPGAGQPIVRTSVPAHMAGGPGALPVQNVRVVQSHIAGHPPGMAAAPGAPGAPGMPAAGGPRGMQQAEQRPGVMPGQAQQRGGEVQQRPGMPPQMAAQMGNQRAQSGEMARPSNGVPRPPQANGGGNPGAFAQQHGMPQQAGQQAAENGRREPAWTQPHTPMAQQAQQAQQGQRPGGQQEQAARPGFEQRPGGQAEGMQPRGAPHPGENPAMQQQAQMQAQQQARMEPRAEQRAPQQMQQAQEERQQQAQQQQEQRMQQQRQQQAQQQQEQRMQQQRQQQAQQQQEQRMQQQRQQQAQQQQEQRMQQQRQQQAQQQQEQRVQQQHQQIQQQRPQQQQQQHAEQHTGGGNRDEHHKG